MKKNLTTSYLIASTTFVDQRRGGFPVSFASETVFSYCSSALNRLRR